MNCPGTFNVCCEHQNHITGLYKKSQTMVDGHACYIKTCQDVSIKKKKSWRLGSEELSDDVMMYWAENKWWDRDKGKWMIVSCGRGERAYASEPNGTSPTFGKPTPDRWLVWDTALQKWISEARLRVMPGTNGRQHCMLLLRLVHAVPVSSTDACAS